jgi:hypothetical protein
VGRQGGDRAARPRSGRRKKLTAALQYQLRWAPRWAWQTMADQGRTPPPQYFEAEVPLHRRHLGCVLRTLDRANRNGGGADPDVGDQTIWRQ